MTPVLYHVRSICEIKTETLETTAFSKERIRERKKN